MPKKMIRSMGHAYQGLLYTLRTERNFRFFVSCFTLVVVLGLPMNLLKWEWMTLLLSGLFFLAVELLNTSIERIADSVDDHCKREHRSHCYTAIRHAKDIAAAASLMSLIAVLMIIAILYLPRIHYYLTG